MNIDDSVAERVQRFVESVREHQARLEPEKVVKAPSPLALAATPDADFSLQLATIIDTQTHGITELASPLSD
jgi:hypothetical protein